MTRMTFHAGLLTLMCACGDKDTDGTLGTTDGGTSDGGTTDGGTTDGGTTDGGTTDGGTTDGGTTDGGTTDGGTTDGGSTTIVTHHGDVVLKSPDEVEDFCALYTRVDGDVWVGGADFPDGLWLDCLTEITGTLQVEDLLAPTVSAAALETANGVELHNLRNTSALYFGALATVPDTLELDGAPLLVELGDFGALTTVGYLRLLDLEALESLGGLAQLEQVTEFFTLEDAPLLSTTAGLVAVRVLEGGFAMRRCDAMTELALPSLERAGPVSVDDSLSVTDIDLPTLASIGALDVNDIELLDSATFAVLDTVTGSVSLPTVAGTLDLAALRTVGGALLVGASDGTTLPALEAVGGIVYPGGGETFSAPVLITAGGVEGNADTPDELHTVEMPLLEEVDGDIEFWSTALSTLYLPSLATVEAFSLFNNTPTLTLSDAVDATSIHVDASYAELDLSSFVSVVDELVIEDNTQIQRIDLSGLQTFGETTSGPPPPYKKLATHDTISLRHLDAVEEVDLSALHTLDGSLHLRGLDSIATVAFDSLETITVDLTLYESLGSDAEIAFPALTTIGNSVTVRWGSPFASVSFPVLEHIGDTLYVNDDENLMALSAPALAEIGGSLYLDQADALTDLDGLTALTEIGEYLIVDDNAVLADITGLEGVGSIGGGFIVRDNPSLSDADAEALRDAIGEENIVGDISISDNGGG